MIDFSKITKTVSGLKCYYLGQRRSVGQVLHRFAVVNDAAELICYYNDQGQRIEFDDRTGKWVATPTGHQIIAPPKIVEVTGWVALGKDSRSDGNGYAVVAYRDDPNHEWIIAKQKHTFRFEVPND